MNNYFLLLLAFTISISAQSKFSKLDSLINIAIKDSIFPGASVLIGNSDTVIYKKGFGYFTYEKNSPEVNPYSIFDLASVTKAFATTLSIMKLYEENKIDLNSKVNDYIDDFRGSGKNEIRIKDLLLHESGLPAYLTPPHGYTPSMILDSVKILHCVYETGKDYKYSCLNFVTLKMIIENVSEKSFDKYYYTNFKYPLELTHTYFNPPDSVKNLCLPTTKELQGIVHDPLARALGGISGNAGLFSNVIDLSKLCKMLLNNGKINDKRIFKEETVKLFTKRQNGPSKRALGFDKKSLTGYSSAGSYFSKESYGHLGYTGTSIWIDPVNNFYVIFLTNRVYPDDSKSISKIRPKVYDEAFKAYFKDVSGE